MSRDFTNSYLNPPFDPKIANPRTLSDLPRKLIAHYVYAIVAYAHYLSLTSESAYYAYEALQTLAFNFFPLLPAVQFMNNGTKTFYLALRYGDSEDYRQHFSLMRKFSAVVGFRAKFENDARSPGPSYNL